MTKVSESTGDQWSYYQEAKDAAELIGDFFMGLFSIAYNVIVLPMLLYDKASSLVGRVTKGSLFINEFISSRLGI